MNIIKQLNLYIQRQSKTVKYGIPFMLFIVCGSFGLKEFAQLRYVFKKQRLISPAEAEKLGINMKQPGEITLETEYEKVKQIDIDNWESIRGPRPWEEKTP